ncbi:hypothetical protein K7X08_011847 [Anisodus acutangulus]|uniref:Uncharacterized protein n=1 Tax=Anisodus acutangulus TaxID=402998 RepID=A0A9Q1QYJ2_9SOLA|nr:hypothetical protein K7X08_011847 [Anisodus acutangulus]
MEENDKTGIIVPQPKNKENVPAHVQRKQEWVQRRSKYNKDNQGRHIAQEKEKKLLENNTRKTPKVGVTTKNSYDVLNVDEEEKDQNDANQDNTKKKQAKNNSVRKEVQEVDATHKNEGQKEKESVKEWVTKVFNKESEQDSNNTTTHNKMETSSEEGNKFEGLSSTSSSAVKNINDTTNIISKENNTTQQSEQLLRDKDQEVEQCSNDKGNKLVVDAVDKEVKEHPNISITSPKQVTPTHAQHKVEHQIEDTGYKDENIDDVDLSVNI